MEFTLEEMKEHLNALEARIAFACKACNRERKDVRLVWVSKFHSKESVQNAIMLGAHDFGENRVQEAEEKFKTKLFGNDSLPVRCHVIGPVQSNKLKKAALVADVIHSITSVEALEKLEKICSENNKTLDILFQVNAGEEETKSGIAIDFAEEFLNTLPVFSHLRYRGLMTIGKNTGVAEDSRKCFAFLRNLQQKFFLKDSRFNNFDQLSMGMTGDLEVAIEEGSTMIRVGTALFGERDYTK